MAQLNELDIEQNRQAHRQRGGPNWIRTIKAQQWRITRVKRKRTTDLIPKTLRAIILKAFPHFLSELSDSPRLFGRHRRRHRKQPPTKAIRRKKELRLKK
ncbi:hypothetical protein ABKV19_015701 [Rosa sericea]